MTECAHEDADYSWGETCDTCGDCDGKCSICGSIYDHINGWPNKKYERSYKKIICPLCKEVVMTVVANAPQEVIDIFAYHLKEELREQIAQEIEAAHKGDGKSIWCDLTLEYCSCADAAAIARGKNE